MNHSLKTFFSLLTITTVLLSFFCCTAFAVGDTAKLPGTSIGSTDADASPEETPVDLSNCQIGLTDTAPLYYTGKALEPEVTVLYEGQELTKGTDYTVTYTGNIAPGIDSASITVTGKGNCTGEQTVPFSILTETPVLTGTVPLQSGQQITWQAVPGAQSYRVFYKNRNKWVALGDTASTTFVDTAIASGTSRVYTVCCLALNGSSYNEVSGYDAQGITGTFIAAPQITGTASIQNGVQITWNKVPGAVAYRVFYKNGGTWKGLGNTTGTSFVDTEIPDGSTRIYTVRCLGQNGSYCSSYDAAGVSGYRIASPVLSSAAPASNGVKITWKAVTGAENYRVFYKSSSGWKGLGNTTGTSFVDTAVKSGETRTYTVRCISKDGKTYTSAYNTKGISCTYIAQPQITAVSNTTTGVQISWGKVTGAAQYRVFYKSGNTWKGISNTTGTSLTFTGAKSGTTYTFTVRCVSANGKAFTSSYDATGKTIQYIAAPTLKSAANSATGVKITWDKVTGAENYRVFYKSSSGWKGLGNTTGTSFVDTTIKSGETRTYTVRCISKDGRAFTSSYNAKGIACFHVAQPEFTGSKLLSATSLQLTWKQISGASGYYVYKKNDSGSWARVKTVTSGSTTSATITGLSFGKSYTFTIRAYCTSGGNTYLSSYNASGYTAKMQATAKYVNGYKLYYDGNGNMITDVEDIIGAQSSYVIKVNKQCNTVTVYAKDGSNGYIIPVKAFVCSTGAATPIGTYYTPAKYRWWTLMGPCYGQWCTRITGSILFHSVWYYEQDNTTLSVTQYNKLGTQCSHGCVRLNCADAKWIYDNCALNTKVIIYNSSTPGPFGKPTSVQLPSWHTWDPTDPNAQYLCKKNGCHAYA